MTAQIRDLCAILSGLVVAQDYKKGQQLVADREFGDNEDFFQVRGEGCCAAYLRCAVQRCCAGQGVLGQRGVLPGAVCCAGCYAKRFDKVLYGVLCKDAVRDRGFWTTRSSSRCSVLCGMLCKVVL